MPRIPVVLRFNDADNLCPAQCSILFRQSAEIFLDFRSMGITGTFLTGNISKGLHKDAY
ncbi:DUF3786 domain-containing protein [Thermodesulfobacteriota bacterium]